MTNYERNIDSRKCLKHNIACKSVLLDWPLHWHFLTILTIGRRNSTSRCNLSTMWLKEVSVLTSVQYCWQISQCQSQSNNNANICVKSVLKCICNALQLCHHESFIDDYGKLDLLRNVAVQIITRVTGQFTRASLRFLPDDLEVHQSLSLQLGRQKGILEYSSSNPSCKWTRTALFHEGVHMKKLKTVTLLVELYIQKGIIRDLFFEEILNIDEECIFWSNWKVAMKGLFFGLW